MYMKRVYKKPQTLLLPVFRTTLLAGSVRNDGTTIIDDGTDPGKIDEGDGSDANSKQNPWGSWDEDE